MGNLFTMLGAFILFGCEITKQNNEYIGDQGYTQLDQGNSKDKQFYESFQESLKNPDSLIFVNADWISSVFNEADGCIPTQRPKLGIYHRCLNTG